MGKRKPQQMSLPERAGWASEEIVMELDRAAFVLLIQEDSVGAALNVALDIAPRHGAYIAKALRHFADRFDAQVRDGGHWDKLVLGGTVPPVEPHE